jgi:hypothetical protein
MGFYYQHLVPERKGTDKFQNPYLCRKFSDLARLSPHGADRRRGGRSYLGKWSLASKQCFRAAVWCSAVVRRAGIP